MDNKILEQMVNTTGEERKKLDKIIAENNIKTFQMLKSGFDNQQQWLAHQFFLKDKEIKDSWDKSNH